MTTRTDDFNRADGGLGSDWTAGSTNAPTIISNAVGASSNGVVNCAYWSADTFGADQYSEIVLSNSINTQGPMVGITGPGHRGVAVYMVDGTQLVLVGYTGGFSDGNLATINGTFVVGDTIRLARAGDLYTVFQNGTPLTPTLTTSAYSGGQPGFATLEATGRIDSWEGGDYAGSPAGDPLDILQTRRRTFYVPTRVVVT